MVPVPAFCSGEVSTSRRTSRGNMPQYYTQQPGHRDPHVPDKAADLAHADLHSTGRLGISLVLRRGARPGYFLVGCDRRAAASGVGMSLAELIKLVICRGLPLTYLELRAFPKLLASYDVLQGLRVADLGGGRVA